jgi:hypothetical protein
MTTPPILTLGLGIFPIVALLATQLTPVTSLAQTTVSVMAFGLNLPMTAASSLNTLLTSSILPFILSPFK